MIHVRTPFRLSLFGGVCDRPEFFSQFGAQIIGLTIDKYCYLSIKETPNIFKEKFRLFYSKTELVNRSKDIQHNGIRGVVDYLGLKRLEMSHISDVPSQTGLGTSSSFMVGLLHGCSNLLGRPLSSVELAEATIYIERDYLQEPGGIQDQIWAAYPGFNSIHITKDGTFRVKPMPISDDFTNEFINRSFLYYVGHRQSFEIATIEPTKQVEDIRKFILEQSQRVYSLFISEDIEKIGQELDIYWEQKSKLKSGITNTNIDSLYQKLKDDGMIGGKLLGSGGSGLIYGVLDSRADIFRRKYRRRLIPFNVDYTGSVILDAKNIRVN